MDERHLDEFRRDAERIFGADLLSLTLYGSHAGGGGPAGRGASVLVVLKTLGREALEGFRAVAPRHARRGIEAPVILTAEFLRRSADVFPLEFLAIAERRRVLSGADAMADVAIEKRNLRHQVEFELKGKLLSLRRLYLGASGGKELAGLVVGTVGPIVAVARGLLLLSDPTAPHGKEEILSAVEKRFGVRLPLLAEAVAARRAGKMAPGRAEEIVFGYMEEVERLCSLTDGYRPEGEGR